MSARYRLTLPIEFTDADDPAARESARDLAEMLRWLALHNPRLTARVVYQAKLQRLNPHGPPNLVELYGDEENHTREHSVSVQPAEVAQ